jgi:Mn-dependent DtxR family transcriptional regulator
MKRIELPHGTISRIADHLGVSLPTVRAALRYKTNHELARRIRLEAMASGGVVLTDKTENI